jgi:branched-chain amino acid transport system substrate-binding protein
MMNGPNFEKGGHMMKKWNFGIMGLAAFLIFIMTLPAWAAEPIKIAIFDPRSGPFKPTGDTYAWALEFLVEEINESGGLLGRKVELIEEDSQLKPDVAVRKATKNIMDGVKFIATGTGTHVALALQQVAAKEKVIFFSYGAEGDEVTGKFCNPYTFRVSPNTEVRSMAIANFLATKPFRKFYTMNMDYAFGHDAAKGFIRRVKQLVPNAQIVGEEYHPIANKDFGPYITKMITANPEVIFTGNWGVDLVNLIKQSRDMGMKAPFMCYYLNDPLVVMPVVKEAAIGSWFCEAYTLSVRTPANKDLLQRWAAKKKFVDLQKWPFGAMGKAYNGTKFLLEAIKKAGTLDIPTIIKTFEGMRWEGVTGPMVMRAEDHQVMMPLPIAEMVKTTNEFYPFPYVGEPTILPMEKTTVPLAETGCTRKKGDL